MAWVVWADEKPRLARKRARLAHSARSFGGAVPKRFAAALTARSRHWSVPMSSGAAAVSPSTPALGEAGTDLHGTVAACEGGADEDLGEPLVGLQAAFGEGIEYGRDHVLGVVAGAQLAGEF